MSDPAPPCVRRGLAVRVPPRGHRVLTYPRPPRPRRRVSTVCVPPIWHRVRSDPTPPCARRGLAVRVPPRGHRVLTYPRPPRPRRRVSTVCVPPIWHRVRSDPTPPCARRGLAVRVPPRGHRVLTYPRPLRPRRRVSIVCVPPIWHRVRSDPTPPCVRRGLAVRVPPRGHRVLTYPRPFRPGRRVSTVCVPRRACRSPTGPVRCKRRRVTTDPAPRQLAWRGVTVRAPPLRHRVLAYPRPPRPRRRVSTVCVPWRLPPSPCRPANTGCARETCRTTLPIPAPTPTRTPTKDTTNAHALYRRATRYAQSRERDNPPLSTWWRGAGGEAISSPTTHQVQPAIQGPPHPRPCSTAAKGFPRQHPSRAPPKPTRRRVIASSAAIQPHN